jgi:flagellar FliL protein
MGKMAEADTAFAVYFNDETKKEASGVSLLPTAFGILTILMGIACGFYYVGFSPFNIDALRTVKSSAVLNKNFYSVPEITANLNDGKSFISLRADLELVNPNDKKNIAATESLLLDSFITYLRELSPSETTGAAGTYALKEDILMRANKVLFPAAATDVLFQKLEVKRRP